MPEWSSAGIEVPSSLNLEQCSSTATAQYKAGVLERAWGRIGAGPMRVADLTGGLGVDSWAFSRVAAAVLYNERVGTLAGAVERNFGRLGMDNVRFMSCDACDAAGGLSSGMKAALADFAPHAIFADPARRDGVGRKVFRLEDCTPNVLGMMPELLETAPLVLLKLSPMADISLVARQLSECCMASVGRTCVREIHVVGLGGECKELLVLIDRDFDAPYSMTVAENGRSFCFSPSDEAECRIVLPEALPGPGDTLFEPSASLVKSGFMKLPCVRWNMLKLAQSTHLYICAGEPAEECRSFGKVFSVLEVLPLNKASMKDVGRRYPKAAVSARNIPMGSDELASRMGVVAGSDVHIFACSVTAGAATEKIMIVSAR